MGHVGAPPAIAVVDDDDAFRRALARLLAAEGYEALQFRSAEEYAAAPPVHAVCVLIDLNLNGVSGLELLRTGRASTGGPPMILMTGADVAITRERAAALGAVALLQKPFDTASLLATIGSATRHGSA